MRAERATCDEALNVDLDPGPGVALRRIPNTGGFVVNLGADGAFHWA
jgi:hypothetical protein